MIVVYGSTRVHLPNRFLLIYSLTAIGVLAIVSLSLMPTLSDTLSVRQKRDLDVKFATTTFDASKEKKLGLDLPPFLSTGRQNSDPQKMQFVKEMMEHAWSGYVNYAWGHDDLQPISKTGYDWYQTQNLLNTPVDALDTLYIMGLHAEYNASKHLILETLDFKKITQAVSVFETVIRVLGGLLAAYDLEGDPRLIEKCVELADLLLPAFDGESGFPVNQLVLATGETRGSRTALSLAEIGSLQLEFQYLSDVTGNPVYAEKALFVYKQLQTIKTPIHGLYPEYIHPGDIRGEVQGGKVSLGGMSDSYYEYLLKMWFSTGEPEFFDMYYEAAQGFGNRLARHSSSGYLFIPAANVRRYAQEDGRTGVSVESENSFDHLACFAGGMFATGALASRTGEWTYHLDIGRKITDYCWKMYENTMTGIGPENAEGDAVARDPRYHLRPEAVESLFYMWRLTHDPVYRQRAWTITKMLEKYCKDDGGYHGLTNVNDVDGEPMDRQESFFLAETLKYLYLIFADDDTIALEKFVFNTEAHVLSVRGHGRRSDTSKYTPVPFYGTPSEPVVFVQED
ncbi:Mannosyl-oligosaccharide 1,2-alpha-mannosidase IA [Chytriomyces hyalinus]|nr:Mannosyl-oligosaccharide 1,2-alpha-mannosidase IA [Chytriomyces hyalinus]